MTIETKFNIGDEVWVRDFEKRGYFGPPILVKIYCILVSIIEQNIKIDYRCSKDDGTTLVVEESHLSPPKKN